MMALHCGWGEPNLQNAVGGSFDAWDKVCRRKSTLHCCPKVIVGVSVQDHAPHGDEREIVHRPLFSRVPSATHPKTGLQGRGWGHRLDIPRSRGGGDECSVGGAANESASALRC